MTFCHRDNVLDIVERDHFVHGMNVTALWQPDKHTICKDFLESPCSENLDDEMKQHGYLLYIESNVRPGQTIVGTVAADMSNDNHDPPALGYTDLVLDFTTVISEDTLRQFFEIGCNHLRPVADNIDLNPVDLLMRERALIPLFKITSKSRFEHPLINTRCGGVPNGVMTIVSDKETAERIVKNVHSHQAFKAPVVPLDMLADESNEEEDIARAAGIDPAEWDELSFGNHLWILRTYLNEHVDSIREVYRNKFLHSDCPDLCAILIVQRFRASGRRNVVINIAGGNRRAGETSYECALRERYEKAPFSPEVENVLADVAANKDNILASHFARDNQRQLFLLAAPPERFPSNVDEVDEALRNQFPRRFHGVEAGSFYHLDSVLEVAEHASGINRLIVTTLSQPVTQNKRPTKTQNKRSTKTQDKCSTETQEICQTFLKSSYGKTLDDTMKRHGFFVHIDPRVRRHKTIVGTIPAVMSNNNVDPPASAATIPAVMASNNVYPPAFGYTDLQRDFTTVISEGNLRLFWDIGCNQLDPAPDNIDPKPVNLLLRERALIPLFKTISTCEFDNLLSDKTCGGVPHGAMAIVSDIGTDDRIAKLSLSCSSESVHSDQAFEALFVPLGMIADNSKTAETFARAAGINLAECDRIYFGNHAKRFRRYLNKHINLIRDKYQERFSLSKCLCAILIVQRFCDLQATKVCINIAGGKRRAGETSYECALRERYEESPFSEEVEKVLADVAANKDNILESHLADNKHKLFILAAPPDLFSSDVGEVDVQLKNLAIK